MSVPYVSFLRNKSAALAHNFSVWSTETGKDDLPRLIEEMWQGEGVDHSSLPNRLIFRDDRDGGPAGTTTDLSIISTGLLFVNSRLAAILRKHDLGDGFLWPVTVVREDQQTEYSETWFGLYLGAWKDTLNLERTTGLATPVALGGGRIGYSLASRSIEKGEGRVVLSSAANEGADLWWESKLRLGGGGAFFLSGRLHEALREAGLSSEFHCHPCELDPMGELE